MNQSQSSIFSTDVCLIFPVGCWQLKMALHILANEISWSNAEANRNLLRLHSITYYFFDQVLTYVARTSIHEQFIGFSFLLYGREVRGKLKLPAQTTAMFQGGEEQEGLAKCKALWDPWPDISHLLHADDFRLEVLSMDCQVHILSEKHNIKQWETII